MRADKVVGICLFVMALQIVLGLLLMVISLATRLDVLGWVGLYTISSFLVPAAVAIVVAGVDYIKSD